jgi:ATP-dependent DNA helicase RecG
MEIKPDVAMFVLCEAKELEGKMVVTVKVQRGTARPYYLAGKGIRPEGVYMRQGASTVPATESAILKVIKETGGDNYETVRSLN